MSYLCILSIAFSNIVELSSSMQALLPYHLPAAIIAATLLSAAVIQVYGVTAEKDGRHCRLYGGVRTAKRYA